MASLITESNGCRRVEIFDAAGKRQRVRIGRVNRNDGMRIKGHLENLVLAKKAGQPLDVGTALWLNAIDDELHGRVAGAGLTAPRGSTRLGPWLEKYLAGRTDLKPSSLRKLQQTRDQLLQWFPAETVMRDITAEQASEWRAAMRKTVSEATARIHSGNAKTFFHEAARRNLVAENRFVHLPSGSTASANERYVTPAEAANIVAGCTDIRFKLIFGLSRYAALRTPSESFALRWKDIDWARARMNVRACKTERYQGHERRTVPIVPALMLILEEALAAAEEGEERVITMKHTGFVPERLTEIIRLAGVEVWDELFQTLRRSGEIEWAMRYPQFVVSRWVGHSITVSGKHYANMIPDEIYAQVTGAAQNAAQSDADNAGQLGNSAPQEEISCPQLSATGRGLDEESGDDQCDDGGSSPSSPNSESQQKLNTSKQAAHKAARSGFPSIQDANAAPFAGELGVEGQSDALSDARGAGAGVFLTEIEAAAARADLAARCAGWPTTPIQPEPPHTAADAAEGSP